MAKGVWGAEEWWEVRTVAPTGAHDSGLLIRLQPRARRADREVEEGRKGWGAARRRNKKGECRVLEFSQEDVDGSDMPGDFSQVI